MVRANVKNYRNPCCTLERRVAPQCTLVGQRTRPLLLCFSLFFCFHTCSRSDVLSFLRYITLPKLAWL